MLSNLCNVCAVCFLPTTLFGAPPTFDSKKNRAVMVIIEANKVYLVRLIYPSPLNDPSPANPIPVVNDWHTVDAVPGLRSPFSIRAHLGIVVHYDVQSKIAILFLGTSSPYQAHRFVPWHGTRRLDYQPLIVIIPSLAKVFFEAPGYVNFTHCVRVSVIERGDLVSTTRQGQANLRDTYASGRVINVTVPKLQMDVLKGLHKYYWQGGRYGADGTIVIKKNDDDSAHSEGLEKKNAASMEHGGFAQSAQQGETLENPRNPIDPITGRTMSSLMAQALREEDVRAMQLELMEGDVEEYNFPSPSLSCFFEPITTQCLQQSFNDDIFDYYPALST